MTVRDVDLEADALASIARYQAFLDTPAFQHGLDVAVLVKIAGDEQYDIRERRRAAEVLAKLRLQAMEGLAELTGARELALDRLGLKPGPQALALTQVNQRIEIVRAKDWRALPEVENVHAVEALPHESTGHAGDEDDGDDPAP